LVIITHISLFSKEKRLNLRHFSFNILGMAVKLFLNSKTILDHVFSIISKNAYDASEVDKFLDVIIQDYRLVEANTIVNTKEYELLTTKYRTLEAEKRRLEVELEKYKTKFANIKSDDNVTTDNIEYISRINTLERFLWAHGFNPDTIK
jgi:DivIVA domain-containing protein